MFPDGADLPIFSGTPIEVVEHPFVPEDYSYKQLAFPGMPPIDYEWVREKDKHLGRRGKKNGTAPNESEGSIWRYGNATAGGPHTLEQEENEEPPVADDERRQRLREALAAYDVHCDQLRDIAAMGAQVTEALRLGAASPELLNLLDVISTILRPSKTEKIRSPADAAGFLMAEMAHLDQEELRTLLLDTKSQIQAVVTVYRGSLNASPVRIGELFKEAIRRNSAALILAHNH